MEQTIVFCRLLFRRHQCRQTTKGDGLPYVRLLLLFLLPLLTRADERWKIQFNYDKDQSSLDIRDIQCPSAQRCIAAGIIVEKNGHEKGTVIVTADGGKQWTLVDVKELPTSLFFLNDSTGWMVTERGVWSTGESGRSWKKLEGLKKGILRVHFLDASHGYAIGFPKAVFETLDGGKSWSKLAEADRPATNTETTVYDCISFSGNHGNIIGRVMPEGADQSPLWMHPDTARFRRERLSTVAILETQDLGKTWNSTAMEVLGHITQLRTSKEGFAIALFEYADYHSLPSSLFKLHPGTRGPQAVFGEPDRAVKDFVLLPDGGAMLAAIEPPGPSNQLPIPGKLKMLRTSNLKVWVEMNVDYRAVAQRAVLTAPDLHHMWVATDTGMILNLVDTQNGSK